MHHLLAMWQQRATRLSTWSALRVVAMWMVWSLALIVLGLGLWLALRFVRLPFGNTDPVTLTDVASMLAESGKWEIAKLVSVLVFPPAATTVAWAWLRRPR